MPSSDSRTAPVNNIASEPPPQGTRPVEEAIAAYRATSYDPRAWKEVAGFVRGCALAYQPADPHRAREVMRTLAGFVIWGREEGYRLDRDELLTPDNVDRYADVALGRFAESSRATIRAILRRVAPVITTTAPWAPRPTSLNALPRLTPYTTEEIAAFRALPQRNDLARHRLRAVLALGAGAGLTGAEYYSSAGTDVWVDASGTTRMQVRGNKARVATFFDDWAEDIQAVAAAVGPGHLLGGSIPANDASRLWHMLKPVHFPSHTGHLQLERLRSSWLLRHLDQATPFSVLLPAAGLRTTSFCTQLLPHLRVPDAEETTAWLTGRR